GTTDDVQRVARAYLKPDRLSVVLVGNVSAFGSDLKGVGFGNFESVDLNSLDLTTADFKHATPPIGGAQPGFRLIGYQRPEKGSLVLSTAQESARAKALPDRVIAAKGGLEKLRSIRNVTADTNTAITTPDDPVE